VESVELDVADAAQFERAIAGVEERHGRIDYLFNNAGIGGAVAEAHTLTLEDWRRLLSINLHGVVHGVVATYPRMVRQGFGHIVNTASVAGLVPQPMMVMYGASKHAVVGLSLNLRIEAGQHGVKVSAVCPGMIQTAIFERGAEYRVLSYDEIKPILPPAMSPEDCARAILRGVARNRPIIIITKLAIAFWLVHRVSVRLSTWLCVLALKRVRRMLKIDAKATA
jgi:NAD(P)-dependent dehydrogenase (short-subunit alcohol dehydrogenase family)